MTKNFSEIVAEYELEDVQLKNNASVKSRPYTALDICTACRLNGVNSDDTLSDSWSIQVSDRRCGWWSPTCKCFKYKTINDKKYGVINTCPYYLEHVAIVTKKRFFLLPGDLDNLIVLAAAKKVIVDNRMHCYFVLNEKNVDLIVLKHFNNFYWHKYAPKSYNNHAIHMISLERLNNAAKLLFRRKM